MLSALHPLGCELTSMKVRKSDLASFLAACETFPLFPWRWCRYRTLTVESLESCFHQAINDISYPCGTITHSPSHSSSISDLVVERIGSLLSSLYRSLPGQSLIRNSESMMYTTRTKYIVAKGIKHIVLKPFILLY